MQHSLLVGTLRTSRLPIQPLKDKQIQSASC